MRRRRPEKRIILPDTKYNDLSVAKFINYIMKKGKKGTAEKIFYGAMNIIENKTKTDGIIEVPKNRGFYLASLWIINSSNSSSGKPMSEKLAKELIAAANGDGGAIKKKDDTHRMADANKAFAHFR